MWRHIIIALPVAIIEALLSNASTSPGPSLLG
jgi:hypothetical protein